MAKIKKAKKEETPEGAVKLVSPTKSQREGPLRGVPQPSRNPQELGSSSKTFSNTANLPKSQGSANEAAACSAPDKWKCGACGNENWLRREVCNSKTCQERRPVGLAGVAAAAAVQRPPPHKAKVMAKVSEVMCEGGGEVNRRSQTNA